MFPSLRSMETQHSLCVPRVCAPKKYHEQQCAATMCPRLPGPLVLHCASLLCTNFVSLAHSHGQMGKQNVGDFPQIKLDCKVNALKRAQ